MQVHLKNALVHRYRHTFCRAAPLSRKIATWHRHRKKPLVLQQITKCLELRLDQLCAGTKVEPSVSMSSFRHIILLF